MASGDKFYLADKVTLDEVDGKIGASNDAESSSTTTGSVFGKINYLVAQVSNYLSAIYSWSNTLLARIGGNSDAASSATSASVHGKLNWFLSLFGETDDTGGSTTTGTVMAKENEILARIGQVEEVLGAL